MDVPSEGTEGRVAGSSPPASLARAPVMSSHDALQDLVWSGRFCGSVRTPLEKKALDLASPDHAGPPYNMMSSRESNRKGARDGRAAGGR
jgi:hypothetical protein